MHQKWLNEKVTLTLRSSAAKITTEVVPSPTSLSWSAASSTKTWEKQNKVNKSIYIIFCSYKNRRKKKEESSSPLQQGALLPTSWE